MIHSSCLSSLSMRISSMCFVAYDVTIWSCCSMLACTSASKLCPSSFHVFLPTLPLPHNRPHVRMEVHQTVPYHQCNQCTTRQLPPYGNPKSCNPLGWHDSARSTSEQPCIAQTDTSDVRILGLVSLSHPRCDPRGVPSYRTRIMGRPSRVR